MNWSRGNYLISDIISEADIDSIYESLQLTYWTSGRPREVVEKSLEKSELLSLFDGPRQIGFIRIVSDYATHAWICDFFIDPEPAMDSSEPNACALRETIIE